MSQPARASSFSILVITLILMIIGAALVPRLPVHLVSTRTRPSLSVSWSWQNASPRLIEQEVTAPLEGLLNTIPGVSEIRSTSSTGWGRINLEFDRKADMDAMRFEVASKIREIYPRLPERVTYPQISSYQSPSEEKTLLTYYLNAPANPRIIQQYAEESMIPKLNSIPGLYKIRVYGSTPMEWELEYNQTRLSELGITRNHIREALNGYFRKEVIGMGWDQSGNLDSSAPKAVTLRTSGSDKTDWQDIPVVQVSGRIFRIRDLCTIRYKEQEPSGYYRINGNNTINLIFSAEKDANSLDVAGRIKTQLAHLEQNFPDGFFIILADDSTEFIRDEIAKIIRRTILSFLILMVFVLLVSRNLKYLLVIFISLIANLLIAVIFYYFFKLEVNLYSMAGITVSLGILIDNTIVMVDHLRTKGNRKVFLAVLAATLTTVGALSVIRFLGESARLQLKDFSYVLITSLFVSLAVALFLVPSLMELVGLGDKQKRTRTRGLRRAAWFGRVYGHVIRFSQRFRWAFIVAAVLLFGLPVNKLPTRMEGEEWYHQLYRATLASEAYVQKIKPVVDKVLGGTLRIFTTKVTDRYRYREPERTAINVSITLPEGATLQQMNDLAVETERYLKQYEQIDQFRTYISSARNGSIRINFKPEFEMGAFPFILYSQMLSLANQSTGADWNVTGVGQYFSNSVSEMVGDQQITLYGYNFEELMGYAEMLMKKVSEHPRAQEAYLIGETERWGLRSVIFEYRVSMDPRKLHALGISPSEVYSYLEGYSIHQNADASVFINNQYEPIRLKSTESDQFDIWMMANTPIQHDESMIRLGELGSLRKELINKTITKESQQYVLTIAYKFKGAYKLAELHRKRVIEEVSTLLPVGFYIKEAERGYWQREKKQQFLLILLVIVIIYGITAILLESLIQPLAVVLIIPISFVGVFLTFYAFNLSFDQGGFASFILLSGIVVNAALYILNDFNIYMRTAPGGLTSARLYLKAYQGKIIPITLTVLSTVLGLVPFITEGEDEVFWFALAAGTMGGLIFSVLAILIFMPAFLPLKHRKNKLKKI